MNIGTIMHRRIGVSMYMCGSTPSFPKNWGEFHFQSSGCVVGSHDRVAYRPTFCFWSRQMINCLSEPPVDDWADKTVQFRKFMAKQKQDDQLEHTYSSYVRIRDVTLKTFQKRWMIGRSDERGSGTTWWWWWKKIQHQQTKNRAWLCNINDI